MDIEDEIDRLYQIPLSEFTASRDALAKRAGPRGPDVRRLQKPSAAAWAVNQLHWRKAKSLDRLMKASARLREAHASRLSGRDIDVSGADAAHREAVQAAADDVRTCLVSVGDSASAATMQAVSDTLHALVWQEVDGRLVRPLKTSGFEALAGLMTKGRSSASRRADVIPMRSVARPTREERADIAAREAAERHRQIHALEEERQKVQRDAREAAASLAKATQAMERAGHARDRAQAVLEARMTELHEARRALDVEKARVRDAEAELVRLEHRLAQLRSIGD